ncbi:MAG: substrate-binding domain-containing protein [Deltaproteobacteria bacterium]|nr:substrate-binding domain-containing protein [Deltaproteobacteria bacterium]
MKKAVVLFSVMFCFWIPVSGHPQSERLRVASTTSTDNTGLFGALNPPFENRFHAAVDVIAQGTGKALKTAERGDCDLVFVHSRPAEEKFVRDGYGVNRRDVMYNDFVIVGPQKDPAGIAGLKDAVEALKRIASAKASFVSRGDDSGTHKREKALWKKARLAPRGRWYIESGQGMGAVLQIAQEKRAYTLSDRGTYLAYRGKIDLVILAQGDRLLFNPYGIIAVNPARYPAVNYVLAMAYIGWVTSAEGQEIIRNFGKDIFGQSLFIPLAVP